MTDIDILNYALTNDIINIHDIRTKIEVNERKKFLAMHDKSVWQGKNGKWYTKLDGKLIKKSKLKDVEDSIIEHYKKSVPTFYNLFTEWIDFKLYYKEIQKQTYDRYESDYKKYVKDSIIDIKIDSINETLLEKYIRDTIRDMNLTAKAWAKIRTILIGTFRWAYKHGYSKINIKEFLDNLELSPKIFKKRRFTDEESVFTDEEVHQITRYIDNVEPSIINYGIILAFQTGLRVGELAALQWCDIEENYLKVFKTEVRYKNDEGNYVYEIKDNTKTDAGNRNVIYLSDAKDTLRRIRCINPFGQYVFMRDNERVHKGAFTKKLERICGYLGIVPKSMHKARKTYATKLLSGGVNEKLILRQMGHTNIKTTDTFYYFNNKTVEQNIIQLEDAMAR